MVCSFRDWQKACATTELQWGKHQAHTLHCSPTGWNLLACQLHGYLPFIDIFWTSNYVVWSCKLHDTSVSTRAQLMIAGLIKLKWSINWFALCLNLYSDVFSSKSNICDGLLTLSLYILKIDNVPHSPHLPPLQHPEFVTAWCKNFHIDSRRILIWLGQCISFNTQFYNLQIKSSSLVSSLPCDFIESYL